MKNKTVIVVIVTLVLLGGGYLAWNSLTAGAEGGAVASDSGKQKVTMYKSPTCGCCGQHAAYLERRGFDVDIVKESNMSSIKDKYQIPHSAESCHTTVIGDYIVEGHVPIEAIDKLLAERPDVDGIGLADMPSGSPGMPGAKTELFDVYALKDGQTSDFISL